MCEAVLFDAQWFGLEAAGWVAALSRAFHNSGKLKDLWALILSRTPGR